MTAELAQRIYPPLLERGRARSGAALGGGGAPASARRVDVAAGASYPPEVAATVYWCCLEALEPPTPNGRR